METKIEKLNLLGLKLQTLVLIEEDKLLKYRKNCITEILDFSWIRLVEWYVKSFDVGVSHLLTES